MAAGDITLVKKATAGHPGGRGNPKESIATVEFGGGGTGLQTVTANQVGLKKIKGWSASVWGATSGVGEFVYSTTAYVAGGVDSVDLECINDASALVDRTVTMKFWGS